jgi:hypothetical protein
MRTSLSKQFSISPEFCIAVDIIKNEHLPYSEIENVNVRAVLIPTLDEISKMMKMISGKFE